MSFPNAVCWTPGDTYILVQPTNLPDWEEFDDWARTLCANAGLSIQEITKGADRAQVMFSTPNGNFLLCYEWLSDTCWIEAMSGREADSLASLYQTLSNTGGAK